MLRFVIRSYRYALSQVRFVRAIAGVTFAEVFKASAGNRSIQHDVIVSLTSFPPRMSKLHYTIRSLLAQRVLPGKIILYLSKDQLQPADLPDNLVSLLGDRFEIVFVDDDLRAYKKFLYALREFPSRKIVTCDDDVIYPSHWLQELYQTHQQHPTCVVCTRARNMVVANQMELAPYATWNHATVSTPGRRQMAIGTGGVLYPPGSLHPTATEQDLFMKLSPMNDDLWLKTMSLLNNTMVVQSGDQPSRYPEIPFWSGPSLADYNVFQNGNDLQIKDLFKHFDINPQSLS